MEKVTTADGNSVPVRYSPIKKEGGSHSVRTGVITAGVAVVFWPAAPFVLLMKGKDTTLTKGMVFDVFTDSKYVLKAKAESATVAAGKANSVSFSSEPSGSDILVDGNFVGSTPSSVSLSPGEHTVRITKGAMSWEKKLTVSPGNAISVNAVLVETKVQ